LELQVVTGTHLTQKRRGRLYSGWLYHLLADPPLKRARRLIRSRVNPECRLIDIGCGTGELLFSLADLCSELVGVEASESMWSFASTRLQNQGLNNVRIIHGDGARLEDLSSGLFDYATACMVFHEMEQSQRLPVLQEMIRVAQTLILVDYQVPPPPNMGAKISRFIERLAGRRHYRNYISFIEGDGLPPLISDLGLPVKEEVTFQKECFYLVRAGGCH
jgi:ubiquinone/menaquinone biosynthesis C-methylase UbiE